MLNAFVSEGGAALLIFLIVIVEGAALWRFHRPKSLSAAMHWLSPTIAGAALILALYLSQRAYPASAIGLALLVAGIANIAGIRARWSVKA